MLLPRFSIRTVLAITTVAAIYFVFAGLGVRGHAWAAAIAIGAGSLAVVALVHAGFFGFIWVLTGGTRRRPVEAPVLAEPTSPGPGPSPRDEEA